MLDSNYRNSSCGFGEDLVAYLYDEIGGKDKSKFEAHLNSCKGCEEELAAFGFVRSSISEWRAEEFDGLEMSNIEIIYNEQINTISTGSNNWFDSLKKIFTFSPNWATATAGFAVLALCAVIAIFAFNYSGQNELAVSDNENTSEKPSKVEEKVVQPQQTELVNEDFADQNGSENTQVDVKPKPELVKEIPAKQSPPKRTEKSQKRIVVKNSKNSKNQIIEIKKPNKEMTANNNPRNNQKLNNFDEEEVLKLSNFAEENDDENDSIRLTDLFDEIGDDK